MNSEGSGNTWYKSDMFLTFGVPELDDLKSSKKVLFKLMTRLSSKKHNFQTMCFRTYLGHPNLKHTIFIPCVLGPLEFMFVTILVD